MPIEKLRRVVLASLMAALTAVGAYIHVPIGPVPIVLSTLFAILSGLLLGSRWGLTGMGLYLLVGAIGMPVFAGGKGADLLRMKIFSERFNFRIEMESSRCTFIPEDKDLCPGRISECKFCKTQSDCRLAPDPMASFNGFWGACSTYGSFSYLKYGAMRLFSQLAQDGELKLGKVIWGRRALRARDR